MAKITEEKSNEPLTQHEIDARREAGLKKLLATPHKPHKPKPGKSPDAKKPGPRGKP